MRTPVSSGRARRIIRIGTRGSGFERCKFNDHYQTRGCGRLGARCHSPNRVREIETDVGKQIDENSANTISLLDLLIAQWLANGVRRCGIKIDQSSQRQRQVAHNPPGFGASHPHARHLPVSYIALPSAMRLRRYGAR